MSDIINIFSTITNNINKLAKSSKVDDDTIVLWNYIFNIVKEVLISKPQNITISPNNNINIIITSTTCKRLSLFKQTVNSVINTWTDLALVDKWFVVDDNSSQDDRSIMVEEYPFIEYYMKSEQEKSHVKSMNIIYDKLVKHDPSYWIHIEDDFLFFYPMSYISTGITGLNTLTNFNVKQIMFNRNYIETMEQINLSGHITYSDDTFALHDYQTKGNACKYWPNFSFRPSIIDVSTIISLGDFSSNNPFFEMDYAKKYTDAGYKTAFFNTITNTHIGKLCNTQGQNAYSLNKVSQFGALINLYNIKVINLKRRPDRLEKVSSILKDEQLVFDVVEAVDGKELEYSQELDKLFRGNDFKSRRTFIGCAMSHYKLWKDLIKSNDPYYIIMEDDVQLCPNFKNKLETIKDSFEDKEIIFMGYLKTKENKDKYFSKYNIESNNISVNLLEKDLYIGGTHCYCISKRGANGLVNYIKNNGIKHGIDYMMVKAQDNVNVYETVPHLSFAEWSDSPDNIIDTDIQNDTSIIKELEVPKKQTTVNDYIFMEKLDQSGYDITSWYIPFSLDKAIEKANQLTDCIAFNTLGFFKNEITLLSPSPYFSNTDGIYINKDYYFNVFKKSKNNRV